MCVRVCEKCVLCYGPGSVCVFVYVGECGHVCGCLYERMCVCVRVCVRV